MKVTWKGVSGLDAGGEELLLVTMRQEYNLVVSKKQIDVFRKEIATLADVQKISSDTAVEWDLEFLNIKKMLDDLQEGRRFVGKYHLETPWQDWPAKSINDVLAPMTKAFGSGTFFSLEGKVPNYSLVYHLGTSTHSIALAPADLVAAVQYVSSISAAQVTQAAALVETQGIPVKEALIAAGVAVAVTAGAVAVGAGLAVGVAAVAEGAIDAKVVIEALKAAAAACALGTAAINAYEAEQDAKRKADKAKEDAAKADKEKQDDDAHNLKPGGGNGDVWDDKWSKYGDNRVP